MTVVRAEQLHPAFTARRPGPRSGSDQQHMASRKDLSTAFPTYVSLSHEETWVCSPRFRTHGQCLALMHTRGCCINSDRAMTPRPLGSQGPRRSHFAQRTGLAAIMATTQLLAYPFDRSLFRAIHLCSDLRNPIDASRTLFTKQRRAQVEHTLSVALRIPTSHAPALLSKQTANLTELWFYTVFPVLLLSFRPVPALSYFDQGEQETFRGPFSKHTPKPGLIRPCAPSHRARFDLASGRSTYPGG